MGRMSDLMIEIEEKEAGERIAKILDISFFDLVELEYKIETDESKDGLIYNYRIEFSEDSSKEILEKINRLEDGCRVHLEPWELDAEYDYDEQFDAITENKEFVQKYKDEIENLKLLTHLKIQDEVLKALLNRQMFIGIIGTMETFLADVFINLTFDNDKYFRNFIETHPELGKRKFELKEIFEQSEKLKETAKKVMLDTIYHNLPKASIMYRDTFEIDFPKIQNAYKYVLKRHDLVHRNGKTKEGKIVVTDEKAIEELIKTINELVYGVAENLNL
jgi:hypothetical protein